MLIVDKPIISKNEDFLNRKGFAKNIANAIENYSDKENSSLTIGLYGKWGSGKTSIINMITEDIENDDVIVFKFEPWIFSDTQQLITNFFKEFAKVIKHTNYADEAKKIGEELETYATFFEPMSLIPEPTISTLSLISGKIFGSVGKASKKWGTLKSKNLSATKSSIEKHLQKLNKKILIIIDDIDRLNNTEIRQVFQMIKVLGNFPNTIYLSSMDKDVVINALSEVQKGDGSEYLEKIINVPFVVPSITTEEVHKFLFRRLDEIIKTEPDENFNQNYWGNVYHSGFKHFFSNIRDIVRYINVLRFNYEVLQNKVNIIDLMASTALQVFEPKVFGLIKTNKELLVGSIPERSYGGDEVKENIKIFIDESSNSLKVLSKEIYIKFLQELFVNINEVYTNTHYVGAKSECRKEAKICSAEYFDTYFTMVLDSKILSSYEMKSFIRDLEDEEKFRQDIILLNKQDKITDFLDKLQDFTRVDIKEENFQILFNVLMDLGDSFPKADEGMFALGNDMQIMRIFHQLLERLEDKNKRFEILKKAMEKAENSIYIMADKVSIMMQEHGEYDKASKHESQLTVKKEDLQELKKLLVLKIVQWTSKCSLLEHKKGLSILYIWLKLNEKEVKEYIDKEIKDDNKLIEFLKLFISYSYSQTSGDYTTSKNQQFNYKNISDFSNINEIAKRLNDIKVYANDSLSKYVIESFKNHYEGKVYNEEIY